MSTSVSPIIVLVCAGYGTNKIMSTHCTICNVFIRVTDEEQYVGTGHSLTHWRIGVIRSINLSDLKIEQKTKVVQDSRFFLRFFFPAHSDHKKPRYASYVPCDPMTRSESKLEISK